MGHPVKTKWVQPGGGWVAGLSPASLVVVTCLAISIPIHAQQATLKQRAMVAFYQNDLALSEEMARQLSKLRPQDPDGWVLLGRTQMAQGKLDDAFESFSRALRVSPRHVDAHFYMGRLSLQLSQGQLMKLFTTAPDSSRAHQLLAEEASALEDLTRAEYEYEAALRADPRSIDALNGMGLIQQRKFKFEKAAEFYERAEQFLPSNYDSLYGLGSVYLYLQQPEKALDYMRRAERVDPNSAPAHFGVGDALVRLGRYEEAVASLSAAVSSDPEMRQAYVLLARAHKMLGNNEASAEALRKSIELTEMMRQKRGRVIGVESSRQAQESAETSGKIGGDQ